MRQEKQKGIRGKKNIHHAPKTNQTSTIETQLL
jgi:hypothetical protein